MATTTSTNSLGVLKPLDFAFPFRQKGQGNAGPCADFTNVHAFHKALAREPSGTYLVSKNGLWHGGIHITEAGAGVSFDLKHGVRCLADGELVAWRKNRAYLVGEVPAQNGNPAFSALYSTGFSLVRHTMEFPRGTILTFFSLYMHLLNIEGYDSDKSLQKPAYWTTAMPDSGTDDVVVPSTPIPIKAGDLIGHLGQYDSLSERTSNRMVHIEVFCNDDIGSFIETGAEWIKENGARADGWQALGLPSNPMILRIDKHTKLYKAPHEEGKNAAQTAVIQVDSLVEMARRAENRSTEITPGADGVKSNWWKIDSADVHHHDISGWVRERNFAGGQVTRNFAQKWVDFKILEGSHDPSHTIFASAKAYADYATDADVPKSGAVCKLSQLNASLYREIGPTGDGRRAADELCAAAKNPWIAMRMSRLIVKHESEWANPGKWLPLIAALEKEKGPQAHHTAEMKRIEKLVWWDEVKAKLPDLPAPNVFHIHPIALVGNFLKGRFRFTLSMMHHMFPLAAESLMRAVMDELNAHIDFYKLDTNLRRSHFFAQVVQEVGDGLKIESENLNYSSMALTSGLFSYFTAHPHEAQLYGRTGEHPADQQAIANRTYAKRDRNGDIASGDGYRYRGRGMIQLTHRGGYRRFTQWHHMNKTQWPRDGETDFESYPDEVGQVKYAVRSACYFWVVNKLYILADTLAGEAAVDAITKIINPGLFGGKTSPDKTKSIHARRIKFERIYKWEGLK